MDKITRLADSCTDSELYRTQIKARDDLLRQLQSTVRERGDHSTMTSRRRRTAS